MHALATLLAAFTLSLGAAAYLGYSFVEGRWWQALLGLVLMLAATLMTLGVLGFGDPLAGFVYTWEGYKRYGLPPPFNWRSR